MIEFIHNGDLFESGCEALVNAVNCRGAMGKGLALEFKKRFPLYYNNYRWWYEIGRLRPGGAYFYRHTIEAGKSPRYIISIATKDHWNQPSTLEWVKSGCEDLVDILSEFPPTPTIKSVAVPALGAGLGGLAWSEVRPLMVAAFERLPEVLFRVYEPLEGK